MMAMNKMEQFISTLAMEMVAFPPIRRYKICVLLSKSS